MDKELETLGVEGIKLQSGIRQQRRLCYTQECNHQAQKFLGGRKNRKGGEELTFHLPSSHLWTHARAPVHLHMHTHTAINTHTHTVGIPREDGRKGQKKEKEKEKNRK